MKINVSFMENGKIKEIKNVKTSELIVLQNRQDVSLEKCDILDDNGKIVGEFNSDDLKVMISQYI